ncbi:MAG: N-acetylmuramoyl-L-alanine amidase [Bacteroidales bacterium]|nr:N-acetylmuramoyl-L-alanine amidase [Bacteroidales bacterium]
MQWAETLTLSSDVKILVPRNTRRSVVVVLVSMALIAITVLFFTSSSYFSSIEIGEAKSRLSLYGRSLNCTLEQFQYLPSVLARYPFIISAHSATSNKLLNRQLANFAKEADLEAIYLMDRTGLVLASSNYGTPQTFVGQNYGFRPYFTNALSGQRGEFFGIGATTGRPGYFISEPVYDPAGNVSSVIAIKLDISELQKAFEEGGERVFVSNKENKIKGPVTTSDLNEQFIEQIEPYILLEQIENYIRLMLHDKIILEEIVKLLTIEDDERKLDSISDMTFGEYQKVFENKYRQVQKGREYHGTVTARDLYVLKNTLPSAIYIELGNIKNTFNQRRLIISNNRQALANWIYLGLKKLYNN